MFGLGLAGRRFFFRSAFFTFVPSSRGALKLRAEIIPLEPDPDNAGEGRMATRTSGLAIIVKYDD